MKVEHQKSTPLSGIRFVDVCLSKGKQNAILRRTDVLRCQSRGRACCGENGLIFYTTAGSTNDVTSNKTHDYIPSLSIYTFDILGTGLGGCPSTVHSPVEEAYFNPLISLQFIMEFMMILI